MINQDSFLKTSLIKFKTKFYYLPTNLHKNMQITIIICRNIKKYKFQIIITGCLNKNVYIHNYLSNKVDQIYISIFFFSIQINCMNKLLII